MATVSVTAYGFVAFLALVVIMVGGVLMCFDHWLECKRDERIAKHVRKTSRRMMKQTEEMMVSITDRTMEKAIEKMSEITKKMYSED